MTAGEWDRFVVNENPFVMDESDDGSALSESSPDIRARIAAAAAETDTRPSEAQKKAENYAKGKFAWNGLTVAIENPRGSFRRGVDSKGKAWQARMVGHYGYFLGRAVKVKGNDGYAIDVFVGQYPESELIFIIDQAKPDGTFDEHKAVIATRNEAEAKKLYMDSFSPGWKGFRAITPFTLRQFKAWIEHGITTRPVAMQETLPPAAELDSAGKLLWESGENYP